VSVCLFFAVQAFAAQIGPHDRCTFKNGCLSLSLTLDLMSSQSNFKNRQTLKPNAIISFILDSDVPIESITQLELSWTMSLLRPLRHWLSKPLIIVKMLQLTPLYITNSFYRQLRIKHFESDFKSVPIKLNESHRFARLISNELLP
jgi:hypothetical protein